MFFLKGKRKVAATGYNNRYNPVCTLSDLLRTRKFLQVLTISPRICRACRPTPCHHSACKRDAEHLRLPKRGGAGGPPHAFAWRLRRFGLAARGRPAEPTPSHSRALGRAPCFGLPTNAGEESSEHTKADYDPAGSGRWCSSVFAKVKATCSRATSRRAHDILGVLLHRSLIIPGQPQVPRRQRHTRHARRVNSTKRAWYPQDHSRGFGTLVHETR